MAIDVEMSAAWREAGAQLQIRVIAPFGLALPDGSTVMVEAFLPDFGGPRGMVVLSFEDDVRAERTAATELYRSLLGNAYRRFDEALFRETLDDWGWFGDDATRPAWYTGHSWS